MTFTASIHLSCSHSISESAAFVDNRSQSSGGAIYNAYDAELLLPDDTTFEGNSIYDVGCDIKLVSLISPNSVSPFVRTCQPSL